YSVTHALGDTTLLPSLVAVPDGDATRPTFVAVHTTPPVSTHMGDWRDDLGWVERLCDQPNVILAGDFNATVDHFPADLGCSDAAQFTGAAALGTWSTSVPSLLGAPIDHVLYSSSWRAVGVSITTDNDEAGSDHRPLTTRLTPAR
ncbi:endonuclease/exonuclease/phosphatase family protein, partial [Klugiella xanthotipulae]